nr:uncharacterized protein LOC115139013 [Oncorhynchus nerka]
MLHLRREQDTEMPPLWQTPPAAGSPTNLVPSLRGLCHRPSPLGGHTTILVVVDRFSKACRLIPLPILPTDMQTVEDLFSHVFRHYEIPGDIVSDRVVLSSPPMSGRPSSNDWVSRSASPLGTVPNQMGRWKGQELVCSRPSAGPGTLALESDRGSCGGRIGSSAPRRYGTQRTPISSTSSITVSHPHFMYVPWQVLDSTTHLPLPWTARGPTA